MAKMRRLLDGTGPYSGFAMACWLIGLLGLLSIVLSTNGLGWWLNAHTVPGHEQGGLVSYTVGRTNYVIDDTKATAASPPTVRTVYYLPSQPSDGVLQNSVNQGLDWTTTVGPGAVGIALLAIGFGKRSQRSRQRASGNPEERFGRGISSETVQALLAKKREKPSS